MTSVQRRFSITIYNQLLERTYTFLNRERRRLNSIKQSKLTTLRENSNNTRFSTRRVNSFSSFFDHPDPQHSYFRGNFEENNSNNFYYSYAGFNQNCVTYLDEIVFNDLSYNDFLLDNSANFVDFSVNVSQLMPLYQQPDLSNQVNSRIKCNKCFDKRRRKRSSGGGGIAISLMSFTLLNVPLTFLAGTLIQKMKLLYSVRAPLLSCIQRHKLA